MIRQISVTFSGIDSLTPVNQPLCAKYTRTFAYYTIKDRLPIILTKIVDQLSQDKEEIIRAHGKKSEDDIKSIIGELSKLKNEVQTNKPLELLNCEDSDVKVWNEVILEQDEPCWFMSPWLLVENYMYRRLYAMFQNSQTLQQFDYFKKQKQSSFTTALPSLKMLAKKTIEIIDEKKENGRQICEMLKFSLWANRCDLSLSCGEQTTDSSLINIDQLDEYLLIDQTSEVAQLLNNSAGSTVTIVQDNAGYELFADLCLADFLCTKLKISHIKFHIKRMPWYVSDVTVNDFNWIIEQAEQEESMKELATRWKQYVSSGVWSLYPDEYWTLPFDYNDMKERAPCLYQSLSQTSLVIFKGDLNYRKLLGDLNWDMCEKFDVCLRSFRPTNVLSLRTVKADCICGLQDGKADKLFDKDPDWMVTGDYGVVQFASKNN